MMGKGRRMGLRLPMLSRTSSQTVMELSIYSASSSSDEEDTLGSDWSEWEDPTWVKDDNLRYANRKKTKRRSHRAKDALSRSLPSSALGVAQHALGARPGGLVKEGDRTADVDASSGCTAQAHDVEVNLESRKQEDDNQEPPIQEQKEQDEQEEEEDAFWNQEGDDVEEEKGIEYLLKKYFPSTPCPHSAPVADEEPKSDSPPAPSLATSVSARCDNGDEGRQTMNQKVLKQKKVRVTKRKKRPKVEEASSTPYSRRPVPFLDLSLSAPPASSSGESSGSGSDTEGKKRSKPGLRETRLPLSARSCYGRASRPNVGTLLRCRSREEVTKNDSTYDRTVANGGDAADAWPQPSPKPRGRSASLVHRPLELGETATSPRSGKRSRIFGRRGDETTASTCSSSSSLSFPSLSTSSGSYTQSLQSSSSGLSAMPSRSGKVKKTSSFRMWASQILSNSDSARRESDDKQGSPLSPASPVGSPRTAPPPSMGSPLSSSSSGSTSSSSSPDGTQRNGGYSLNKAADFIKKSRSVMVRRDKKEKKRQSRASTIDEGTLIAGIREEKAKINTPRPDLNSWAPPSISQNDSRLSASATCLPTPHLLSPSPSPLASCPFSDSRGGSDIKRRQGRKRSLRGTGGRSERDVCTYLDGSISSPDRFLWGTQILPPTQAEGPIVHGIWREAHKNEHNGRVV